MKTIQMYFQRSKTYTILLLVVSLFLWSCGGNQVAPNQFGLSGAFPACNVDSFHVYQLKYEVTGIVPRKLVSAVAVNENNETKFTMTGELPGPGFYLVGKAPNNLATVLLGGEKGVTMTGNCGDLRRFTEISNSPLNESFNQVSVSFTQIQQQINQANQQLTMAANSGNVQFSMQMREQLLKLYGQQLEMVDSLKEAQPLLAKFFVANLFEPFDPDNNPKGYTDALDHFGNEFMGQVDFNDPTYESLPIIVENMRVYTQQIFQPQFPMERSQALMDNFLQRLPDNSPMTQNCMAVVLNTLDQLRSPAYLTYANRYKSMFVLDPPVEANLNSRIQRFEAEKEAEKLLGIGAIPPEIELPTPEGNMMKLSDLRGKVVLLDFWASWCKPCRMENPNVVKVYNKYKDKGFDILSVSLDRSRDPWLQAIEKDQMTWNHVSDLKFWQSKAAKTYRVSSIPATFLLDKDGRILAKNLRGPALEAKVKEILGS